MFKELVMRKLLILLAVVLGGGSLALAQATTMPAVQQPLKVLIVPFRLVGNATGHEWVASAIQENLMTQAAGNTSVQAIGISGPLGGGPEAIEAAKNAGATLVVFGTYEISDSQLRVNGQIADVNYGRTVAALKATGAITDLFKIEDTLSSQLGSALPQPPANLPVVYGPDQSAIPYYTANQPVVASPAPTYVYSPPTYVYDYPAYSYPYYYDYPVFPVVVYGGYGWGHPWHGGFVGGGYRGGGGFHGSVGFHGGGGFGGHGR
jgi:TolB-like protein